MSLTSMNFDHNAPPPHPGEILREDVLPNLGLSEAGFARHLGVSVHLLGEILAERHPVTLDVARRLAAAFGSGAHYWLGLQIQHDLYVAQTQEPPVVKPLPLSAFRTTGSTLRAN